MEKKDGDDTGMQTRVWGPGLWLSLHCIAQNYPWDPDSQKKEDYLNYFRLIGKVLPCRYCRESYQNFIKEPGTILNEKVMENRKTLTKWLYDIHNKVNKKLGICNKPSLEQVWEKYESFRSKCTKSPEFKIKKGCTDPLKGYRKKCVYSVINIDKDGNPIKEKNTVNFGKGKETIKLISIKKSNRPGKKLMATFEKNGRTKITHFGNSNYQDYTKHHDILRRNRYIKRHLKDLKTGDPTRAGFLSMFVLWNKKSLQASISDYRRRLKNKNWKIKN